MTTIMRTISDAVTSPEVSDPDDLFGQYIASQMKMIKDPTQKLILQNRITNACFEARMGASSHDTNYPSQASTSSHHQPTNHSFSQLLHDAYNY